MKDKRFVAICGGGDWADASVGHLKVPVDLDLSKQKELWRVWYDKEYCPALRAGQKPVFISFVDWLKQRCGAEDATEIEEFYDN